MDNDENKPNEQPVNETATPTPTPEVPKTEEVADKPPVTSRLSAPSSW